MKVFVYGTLKKGGANHTWIYDALFLGKAVVSGYQMHDLGSFPGVTRSQGGLVHGELYEVETLQDLDLLEGYPRLYNREITWAYTRHREQVNGHWVTTMRRHEAWIYFLEGSNSPVIPDGVWDV